MNATNWVTEHYAFYDSYSSPTNSRSFVTRKLDSVTTRPASALDFVSTSLPATTQDANAISNFVTEMSSYDHFTA